MSIIDNLESQLWVEKYAPQCVEDTILPDRIKNVYGKCNEELSG
jgi:hypothetical protein